MDLSSYIAQLEKYKTNLPDIVDKALRKTSSQLLSSVKLRLYQRGLDGDLNSLGVYAAETIARKRAKGQIASHVTLRDTGAFYQGMHLLFEGDELLLGSYDSKTGLLVEQYGDAILEFSPEEKAMVDIIFENIEDEIIRSMPSSVELNV